MVVHEYCTLPLQLQTTCVMICTGRPPLVLPPQQPMHAVDTVAEVLSCAPCRSWNTPWLALTAVCCRPSRVACQHQSHCNSSRNCFSPLPRRSAPDLSAVREGDLSDRLHQQDDRGTGVPFVQGPRCAGLPWWIKWSCQGTW